MEVLKGTFIGAIDIDGTLIRPVAKDEEQFKVLLITDPHTGTTKRRIPMKGNIELLKKWKKQGYTIMVWSAGSVEWALEVIKILELEEYVDQVMTKPIKYVDDLDCNQWMGNRVFVGED